MNLKSRNIFLSVAAVVLAIPTVLQLRRDADTFVDLRRVPLLFDGFTEDNVGQILLAQPKAEQPAPDPQKPDEKRVAYDQLVLVLGDKGWSFGSPPGQPPQELQGAPVLKERVENDVFTHLRAIRSDREVLVRANATPDQLAEYGLDELHAFVIRAVAKGGLNVVAELMVGRDASVGQTGTESVRGVYLRKSDSTDVILYEWEKPWRRDVVASNWLDRTLVRLEPTKITKLSLRNAATAGTTFTFAREPGHASWHAVEPPAGLGAVRQAEVEALVQRLRWLSAQDYRRPMQQAGNLQVLGLVPAQIELEITERDGDRERVVKVSVGNKLDDKNEYYLACSESAFLMTWPAGMVTTFEVDVRAQWFDPVSPDAGTEPPREDRKDK